MRLPAAGRWANMVPALAPLREVDSDFGCNPSFPRSAATLRTDCPTTSGTRTRVSTGVGDVGLSRAAAAGVGSAGFGFSVGTTGGVLGGVRADAPGDERSDRSTCGGFAAA